MEPHDVPPRYGKVTTIRLASQANPRTSHPTSALRTEPKPARIPKLAKYPGCEPFRSGSTTSCAPLDLASASRNARSIERALPR